MPIPCDLCGVMADGDVPPLSWSLSMDGGQVRRYCESCTRTHLRTLEGKLDPARW